MKAWTVMLCLAGLIFSYWLVYNKAVENTETRLELHYQTEQNKLRDQYDQRLLAIQRKHNDAIQTASIREAKLKADADSARAAVVSLRLSLSKAHERIREASRPAVDEYAVTVSELYGECEAELAETAAKADGHASDAMKLRDAWPKSGE